MNAPTLVFAWGNPSRGDDALGPRFAEAVEAMGLVGVECLTDFQLQVEHVLDLRNRSRVLFVDATVDATAPFAVSPLAPAAAAGFGFTSHALSPATLLAVYRELEGPPPPAWLLAIAGRQWELGQPPGDEALTHLDAALGWARRWLAQPA
ncbi:hydrogenase maturation protease [Thauera chlorobenzoica]|uniref:Ni,Fe-hydrogenase maturation protease HoxW n=1 Tax=Thauera chlorobenzoica TaxID=96773 RepID=A0A1H5XDH2_9RHOO|nr:hydrogenase maturation protease [Thauera chlorobenzoica]APR05514.1 Ni,Fe-hydrogenase maturation protease HoxW [Thauera chlorobenzoica]SEG09821.1 hydrogenase maturation protease [Thauera chlorobenzoica]